MPRIDTLHQLIDDLEKRSAVIASMGLAKTPDCRLSDELAVFANQDGEKDIIAGALEYLVNKASLDLSGAKTMLEAVLNEKNFSGAFTEVATYGWLGRHALPFKPQVQLSHPEILNPNPTVLDGILELYGAAFDVKAFGLAAYLANKLAGKLLAKGLKVDVNGPMDVDVKTVQTEALEKIGNIEAHLRGGNSEYKIPSLHWTVAIRPNRLVNLSVRTWEPYKQAEELRFYPFKQAAQFTTNKPFMLIFGYLPRFNPFLHEDSTGFTEKFFRSLARRAFIELSNDPQPLFNFDERVKGVTLGEASQLLSAIMFIDLNSERYHVFYNPRAKNPIWRGIVNLTMDTHPVTSLASYDDFEHDNY
jgi:hypothetical protein